MKLGLALALNGMSIKSADRQCISVNVEGLATGLARQPSNFYMPLLGRPDRIVSGVCA